jgi:hypothetical protein
MSAPYRPDHVDAEAAIRAEADDNCGIETIADACDLLFSGDPQLKWRVMLHPSDEMHERVIAEAREMARLRRRMGEK